MIKRLEHLVLLDKYFVIFHHFISAYTNKNINITNIITNDRNKLGLS